jgi:hypothetical protein
MRFTCRVTTHGRYHGTCLEQRSVRPAEFSKGDRKIMAFVGNKRDRNKVLLSVSNEQEGAIVLGI